MSINIDFDTDVWRQAMDRVRDSFAQMGEAFIQIGREENDRLSRQLRANQDDLAQAQERRQQWVAAQERLQS